MPSNPPRDPPEDAVAVVGLACRFPGAPDAETFWRNLEAARESVSFFSVEELAEEGIPAELLQRPEYVRARAVLEDADCFDASFFGQTPGEARAVDPQHRLFLECVWTACEDAGLDPGRVEGAVGLFAGASSSGYGQWVARRPGADGFSAGMNAPDFLATRVAHALDLRGPALSVQTACSTSLVAVHLACQALLNAECDVALAGGVSARVPFRSGYLYQEGGVVSPDGHCRAFDTRAAGTVPGSGVGVVVLKRLADALSDGDTVRAVVRGSAVNNDGAAKAGYTAPSAEGQARVVAEALAVAGVPAETVTYVEAHGTATEVGDPIEVAALVQALGGGDAGAPRCALGSVKTNFGHLDAAAGVAGLIKTVLALERRTLPPSLHFETPNPRIDFGHRFYVQTAAGEWPADGHPRRAGVSSFGIGGTNAHVVLEEAPPAARPETEPARPWQVLPLSGHTPEALARVGVRLGRHLEGHPELSLPDVAFTLQWGRRPLAHRRAVVARSREEAVRALEGVGETARPEGDGRAPIRFGEARVAFLFPGQGSRPQTLGRELYETEAVVAEAVDRGAELLEPELGLDLRALLLRPAADEAALLRADRLQPSLFLVEYALGRLWLHRGVEPEAMLGHSLGEYVAACLAGVFSLEDALAVVAARGRLVHGLPAGAMTAVARPEEEVAAFLGDGVSLAAVNAPRSCVVSGPVEAVAALERRWAAEGIAHRRMETTHAFHSAMLDPILEPFRERLDRVRLEPPRRRVVSSLTGRDLRAEEARDPEYWVRQMRQPVRFRAALGTLLAEPDRVFLEVGPGRTLGQLARRQNGGRNVAAIPSLEAGEGQDDVSALLAAAGRLWAAGAPLDWSRIEPGAGRRRVPLPTYPFARERHMVPAPSRDRPAAAGEAPGPAPAGPEPAAAAPGPPGEEHEARVARELAETLGDLLGLPAGEVAGDADLLDLGLDSLLVMQLSQRIDRRLGVKVPFRSLLEELSNLRDLTAHLAAQSASHQAAQREVRGETEPPAAAAPAPSPAPSPTPSGAPPSEAPSFGPYRPVRSRTGAGPALGESQRRHLDALTARYTARTRASKEAAARHRGHLADSRASASFRRQWKELVYPLVGERSRGARIWDLDGHEYVDFTMGFGVHLFGHSPPFVMEALREQMERGLHIGPQSDRAGDVARRIAALTGLERVAFCNTGTEAVMAAVRLARAVTARPKVALFAGSYHGSSDGVLARGRAADGDPAALPAAPGVPASAVADLLVLEYGAPASLEVLRRHAGELAAILVEPVQSRRPDRFPREFLRELRHLTREHGIALVFDEVITGFRFHPAGAQGILGFRADLATYGKVLGGGLPIGVVAGSARFMDAVDGGPWWYGDDSAPSAIQTVFAGTFSKNPPVLAAAEAVLAHLEREGPALQEGLTRRTAELASELEALFRQKGAPLGVLQGGSLFRFVPLDDDPSAELLFFHLVERGVYVWEGRGCFLSTAHGEEDLELLVSALGESLDELRTAGFLTSPGPPSRPLTPSQLHLWVHTQVDSGAALAYNELLAYRLRGPLDRAALGRAVQWLADRHEALRVTFSPEGDRQVLRPELDLPLEEPLEEPAAGAAGTGPAALLEREIARPFDLERGPLVRTVLHRLEDGDHLFVLAVHHLVADGYSMGILARNLVEAYAAAVAGEAPAAPAPLSYRDWLDRRLDAAGESERRDREAWIESLRGARALEPTPDGVPEGGGPTPSDRPAGQATAVFEGEPAAALLRRSRELGSTVPALLTGAFLALLHRLYDRDDLLIGLPSLGRDLDDDRSLVGHCVDLLPLRSRVEGDPTAADVVAATRRTILEAREHGAHAAEAWTGTPGEGTPRGRAPRIEVVFNVEGLATRGGGEAEPPARVAGVRFEPVPSRPRHSKFGLTVDVTGGPERLGLTCTYDAARIDRAWAAALLERYRQVLAACLERPELRLSELPILTAEEERRLREWNRTGGDLDPDPRLDRPLYARFHDQAERTPDAVAVVYEGEGLSYAALRERAHRLARRLRARGVGLESLVGVCLERSVDLVVALVAVVEAGAAHVPLDPGNPPERLAGIVADARLRHALVEEGTADPLAGMGLDLVRVGAAADGEIDAATEAPSGSPELHVPSSARAYAIFTSGSTGRPKGVMNNHRGMVNQLLWMEEELAAGPWDRVLHSTPLSFDASVWEVFLPLGLGGRVVVARPDGHRDPAYLAAAIEAQGITLLHFVPSLLRLFIEEPDLSRRCRSLRRVVASGEALPADVRDTFLSRLDADLYNYYGPCETAVDVVRSRTVRDGPRPVPLGAPAPGVQIHVLDGRLLPVAPGFPGELHVGGVQVSRGYLHAPARTAARFVPDPFAALPGARLFRTGDRGRWTGGGTLEFLGRLDDQVKIRGQRVEPGEVEAVLRAHPAVRDVAVTAREAGSERAHLVAYVVPAEAGAELPEGELRAFAARKLPESMVPSLWEPLAALPLNRNGKLDRRALPEPRRRSTAPDADARPRTPAQERVAAAWREVLGVEPGLDDNFFEVGGNSLLIVRVHRRLAPLAEGLTVTDLFAHPTIRRQAERVAGGVEEEPPRLERRLASLEAGAGRLASLRSAGAAAPVGARRGEGAGGG